MIELKMYGGLGNQLFIYAFGRCLAEKGRDHMRISFYNSPSQTFREFELEQFCIPHEYFNSPYPSVSDKEWLKSVKLYRFASFAYKAIRRIFGAKCLHYIMRHTFHSLSSQGIYIFTVDYIDPVVAKTKHKIVDGYWQSEKYFHDIKNILQTELKIKTQPSPHHVNLLNSIKGRASVCVHIRRGDYLSHPQMMICSLEYYQQGMEYIRSLIPDCTYYIFSDEIEWVKEHMSFPYEVNYVDNSSTCEDLRLMYSCKHFVISNSSYSWWAQYLSDYPNKIVVAPDRWTTQGGCADIYQDNWHCISV